MGWDAQQSVMGEYGWYKRSSGQRERPKGVHSRSRGGGELCAGQHGVHVRRGMDRREGKFMALSDMVWGNW